MALLLWKQNAVNDNWVASPVWISFLSYSAFSLLSVTFHWNFDAKRSLHVSWMTFVHFWFFCRYRKTDDRLTDGRHLMHFGAFQSKVIWKAGAYVLFVIHCWSVNIHFPSPRVSIVSVYVYMWLCSDASSNVRARAVKDYCNAHDPSHISFREGDLITVRHTHHCMRSTDAVLMSVGSRGVGWDGWRRQGLYIQAVVAEIDLDVVRD